MMKENLFRRHHLMMVALFCLLCALYMLVYNGRHSFNDELQMFDTTASMVDFGDTKYDLAMWYVWNNYGLMGQNTDELYPLITSPIEPVFSTTGTPFYWLARQFSWGLLHTTFLLNVIVGALLCVVFFAYARLLGYADRIALFGALALGICTIVLPYTKTYMRELLAMLFLLGVAVVIELSHLQITLLHRVMLLISALVLFLLAFFTKESSLMLLPMLLFFLIPPHFLRQDKKWFVRLGNGGIILSIIIIGLLIYTPLAKTLLPDDIPIFNNNFSLSSEYTATSLHNYFLSLNGSLWGTSPILLLGLIGGWLFLQQKKQRLIWGVWLGVLGITIGHAFTTGVYWFAGATLPPRFIMLVIPFVMLWVLPVFERVYHNKRHWLLIPVLVLVIISLYSQFIHSALDWRLYPKLLPPEANELTTWLPSLNLLQYSRTVLMTPALFETQLDYVWIRTNQYLPMLIFLLIVFASGWVLWRRRYTRYVILLPIVLFVTIGLSLPAINHDPLHFGDREALHAVGEILDEQGLAGDVLLLSDPLYVPFFLNHRAFDDVRVVSVQSSPGERYSFEQVPQVTSDDVRYLLAHGATLLIDALMVQRPRLWVLMETSPFLPWAKRPVEHYLSQYYYFYREVPTGTGDVYVRLLEYATTRSPDPRAEHSPQVSTDFLFDDQLALIGVTMPNGDEYAQGDILPITLYWEASTVIAPDYRIAIFLADEEGFIYAQGFDTAPMGGFMPTNTLTAGQVVTDNRALGIPVDLPIGDYQLLVRIYTFSDDGTLINGVLSDDTDIAKLPIIVSVTD